MRNSKILDAIRRGESARIAMMGHYLPPFVAYASQLGFDGIWLDLEHRNLNPREVQALLAFFHRYDIDCLVRPATREKAQLYRYLEDGATGIVVPHVNTPEEAHTIVQSVKFPPVGDRGTYPSSLDTDFGLDTDNYIVHSLQETFVLVQIETPEALDNLHGILSVNGLDGVFLGPADIQLRMQHLPEMEQSSYPQILDIIASTTRNHGKLWGSLASSVDDLHDLHVKGAQLLMWGIDQQILRDGLSQIANDFNRAMGQD